MNGWALECVSEWARDCKIALISKKIAKRPALSGFGPIMPNSMVIRFSQKIDPIEPFHTGVQQSAYLFCSGRSMLGGTICPVREIRRMWWLIFATKWWRRLTYTKMDKANRKTKKLIGGKGNWYKARLPLVRKKIDWNALKYYWMVEMYYILNWMPESLQAWKYS